MGLLDNLGELAGELSGRPAGATDVPPGDAKAALVQAVMGMLLHGNEPGGLGGSGGFGGLGGLLERFQASGLGPQVASWIGNGANQPVSAEQVRSALGDGPLRTLAEHVGLSEDETAAHLSGLLPQLVDHLTPNGQTPDAGMLEGGVAGALSSLGHLFGKR
jgi:uncharacterized protein YidB (DUF937 family)